LHTGGLIQMTADELSSGEVEIRVKDTGVGLPVEIQKDPNGGLSVGKENGTGMGLSFVYDAVSCAGGIVDFVTSKEGTTFILTFPGPGLSEE